MSDLIKFDPIDAIELEELRSLARDYRAEISRLKIARIPHKDDDALGLALLNQFVDSQRYSLPEVRKHLVGTITATTAPLRDEIARMRDLSENVVIAFGMGWDMDAVIDLLRLELEQKP